MKTKIYKIKAGELFTFLGKHKKTFPNTYMMLFNEYMIDLTNGLKFDVFCLTNCYVNKLNRFLIER